LQGQLLIATPELVDPNFLKTVVLMVRHNHEGGFGFVLNRPSGTTVKDIWEQLGLTPCEREEPLFLGGPVEGPLTAVHRIGDLGDLELLPGVHMSTDAEKVKQLIARTDDDIRFVAGYSGWGPGQLENEIGEGSWVTSRATDAHVFHTEADLWKRVRSEMAVASLADAMNIRHIPRDPSAN